MAEEIVTKLQAFLQEVKTEDYIKIKYEDLTEMLKETINTIKKQQAELEKKDKVLYEMAEWIFDKDYSKNSLLIHRDDYYSNCVKQVIKNFEKKVEGK